MVGKRLREQCPLAENNHVRIAIVGTGIAGLASAWLLNRRHAITVFEAEPRLGGHTNTVTMTAGDREIAVDTGFIVYNEHTYPLLTKLLAHLDVRTEASDMSFSASIGEGALEYAGSSMAALFAQRRNALRPSFLRMLVDIGRFNRLGWRHLREEADLELTVGQFLARHGFGKGLAEWYLLPMAAAIWSAPVARMLDYPARSFLAFFANHGLLSVGAHRTWRTVAGGSRAYVERMLPEFRPRVRLATPIVGVRRWPWGVELLDDRGERYRFDQVVLACHADQSLAMLEDASDEERALLGAFRYQPNRAVLHRDPALMPRRRGVWASWNYLAPARQSGEARVSVTYWMNRLQNLDCPEDVFVSLNPLREPDPLLVHAELDYAHPVFDTAAVAAQGRMHRIQGKGGLWHAGAWLGYGFHEDGLRAGLDVARALGAAPPWEAQPQASVSGAMGLPERAAAQPA
jgi:predicted NAD/FAD-binding protein